MFAPLGYAVPKLQGDGSRTMAEDPGNRHDTPETVAAIQQHNVRYDATCPKN